MQKFDVKDKLGRNGFVYTDLGSRAYAVANGPRGPGDVKTRIRVVKDGETVHMSMHSSNSAVALKYVELVEEYG